MSRDLRKYAKATNIQLVIGAFLLLIIVGLGLVWLFFGINAAGMGFLCILAGLTPIILILLLFLAADWILKRATRK